MSTAELIEFDVETLAGPVEGQEVLAEELDVGTLAMTEIWDIA